MKLSSRAKHLLENIAGSLGIASPIMVADLIETGQIFKFRGAGQVTVNELRKYAGLRRKQIKRCACCGNIIK